MQERLSVQQRIKKIAEHFTACKYIFANWAQMNVELDRIEQPTICYILPPSGMIVPERNAMQFTDRPLTQIAFLSPTDFDFDGEKNDEIVEMMKILAIMFVKEINKSELFEFIDEEIEYQVPYDTMDDNVTGVVITLPIVEKPFSACCVNGDMFGYVE